MYKFNKSALTQFELSELARDRAVDLAVDGTDRADAWLTPVRLTSLRACYQRINALCDVGG